ncbi:E1-like protein-activating [Ascodesmis nigricans]|uniref:Ubiquitin-like modifier-activating enzyme ATG7 n=1 Tax=Ascodesmis nigricans TaxID=341454 RepID=A0A4S2MXL5_9PEZI|nr:E1-like protein-activating [Ascodesmis nigricans]
MSGASTPTTGRAVKYAAFESAIELPFYYNLASHKIEYDKLNDAPRRVLGQYIPRDGQRMQIQGNALTADDIAKDACRAEGMIKNFNTIEDFKRADRPAMLQRAAKTIWDAILDGSIYSCPSLLSSFLVLCYADLKKYKFHHLFAFPAFASSPPWTLASPIERLSQAQTASMVESVNTWRYRNDSRQRGFFLVKRVNGRYEVGGLGDYEHGFFSENVDPLDRYVAFVDPSEYDDNPGWPLRNLLVLVRKRWGLRKVKVLCYRDTHDRRYEARSMVLDLELEGDVETLQIDDQMPKVVGWEKNENNQVRPRIANLSAHMDPKIQADINVDLNLKLMKWRVAPTLDLEKIKNTKCLLLGAGTLGAYVGRLLMGWGVRNITFIDSGSVSFSNPVRQPLYNFKDCIGGTTKKALAAAAAMKEIYPGVNAIGHDMTVPMAAHPFSASQEPAVKRDYEKLKDLFESHDAIFLLMDTRESRWLPTVMGKAMNKLVLNAALGFDSYVVMRHGVVPPPTDDGSALQGEELGCYYCNDVVAPADSLTDQTLDQQCTVTRPGIAPIASGLLVELLISTLQHPLSAAAPAPKMITPSTPMPQTSEHPLGHVPHQMRGFLGGWQNMVVKGSAYDCCAACSARVVDSYREGGWEFVKRALCEKGWVEEVSGLREVQRRAEEVEMGDWGSDEEEEIV